MESNERGGRGHKKYKSRVYTVVNIFCEHITAHSAISQLEFQYGLATMIDGLCVPS